MTIKTPNHELNQYNLGDTNWSHTPDMLALEQRVTVRDTEANLSNYVPYLGAKFEALDTEAVFFGTGDGWYRTQTAGRNPSVDSLSIAGWNLIDVSQHGFNGDRSGGDLAQFIADNAGDVAFYLPEGTYNWERPLAFDGGSGTYSEPRPERLAIIGQPRATIHVDMPTSASPRNIFRFGTSRRGVNEVILKNLHFDIGDADPDRDAGIMRAYIENRMDAENLSLTKRHRRNSDDTSNGDRHTYLCNVVNPEGVATHKRIDLTAGDVHRSGQHSVGHAIPFAAEPPHFGTNRWIDCKVAGYTDNGYYVRDGIGANILRGCLARNCGGGHFRLGQNDSAYRCRVVIDGTESPANGTALWVQEGESTAVDGMVIDAPALQNDAIRVSHRCKSASIKNIEAHVGACEYAIKATADTDVLTFENIRIHDEGNGYTRVASILADSDNTTYKNVTLLNRDHGSANGRAAICVGAENNQFRDCRFLTDNPYAVLIGHPTRSGRTASVRFNACSFENVGGAKSLIRYNKSPVTRQFILKDSDIDPAYGQLITSSYGDITDWEVAAIEDNLGLPNERVN